MLLLHSTCRYMVIPLHLTRICVCTCANWPGKSDPDLTGRDPPTRQEAPGEADCHSMHTPAIVWHYYAHPMLTLCEL